MSPLTSRFAVRPHYTVLRLLLTNLAAAAVLVWMIRLCRRGNPHGFDGGKISVTVALVFGMPSVLAWALWRASGGGRGQALRVGAALHCLLMASLCAIPPAFWPYYLIVRRGPMTGARYWQYFHWTFEPSLSLVALYSIVGAVLYARRNHDARMTRSQGASTHQGPGRTAVGSESGAVFPWRPGLPAQDSSARSARRPDRNKPGEGPRPLEPDRVDPASGCD